MMKQDQTTGIANQTEIVGEEAERLLELAQRVAEKAHAGQLDKGGNPYILHPQAVAAAVSSTEQKIIAYLHDVCEDSDITPKDLLGIGFPEEIVHSIRILIKAEGISYEDYLKQVKADRNARAVKMADIRHNMDISRISEPTAKDYTRIEKYIKALSFLENG